MTPLSQHFGNNYFSRNLMTSLNFTRNISLIVTFHTHLPCVKNRCLFVKGRNKRKKKLLKSFPTNFHDIVEKFSCNDIKQMLAAC